MVGALVNASRHSGRKCSRCGRCWLICPYGERPSIGLAVQCPDRKYFRSVRVPRNVYDQVLEFLKRNHGRTFREVMDAEIDISDVIQ
jgi:ferredoxin